MKDIIFVLFSYLKLKVKVVLTTIISMTIYFTVIFLYSLPLEPAVYATSLIWIFLLLVGIYDFIKYYKKYSYLEYIKNNFRLSNISFSKSKDLIIRGYEEIIETIAKDRLEIINERDKILDDMVDYYTIWGHQIKTPIAAMKVLLQSEKSSLSTDALDQLFKIEQYVEMVLQYLRLGNMSSDLQIKKHSLDKIIKQAVRKYSKFFIRKR